MITRAVRAASLDTPLSCLQRKLAYATQVPENVSKAKHEDAAEKNGSVGASVGEKIVGQPSRQLFKAETKRLLEIVANSLYSEKEVFVRELASNAADACEKLRYYQLTNPEQLGPIESPLEIHVTVDKERKLFIMQDFGIGMDRKELEENLGTIALSGAGKFLEMAKSGSSAKNSIVGQFGVGFYSAFTVGNLVQVYSRSALKDSKGHAWVSDGLGGEFTISEAENVQVGTKIVVHLKEEESAYSDQRRIEGIIKKYSNFVGFPLKVNGQQINTIQPLWTMDKSTITEDQYSEFYKFISDSYDAPLYKLQYATDAPVQIRSLLFIPKSLPMLGLQRDDEPKISLYSKKVLIKGKTNELLPSWLGFVRGVVDSEDIPLNLSRELLQNNLLIQKIKRVLTGRIIRWLQEEQRRNPEQYLSFYKKVAPYLKGGILQEQEFKKDMLGLLLFESSDKEANQMTTLKEYVERIPAAQSEIYVCLASNRDAALHSPYYEPFKQKGIEVLFSFDKLDDFLISAIEEYDGKKLVRIEDAKIDLVKDEAAPGQDEESRLSPAQLEELCSWFTSTLDKRVKTVKPTHRMFSHPAIIVDYAMHSMSMKYFRQMMGSSDGEASAFSNPPVDVEINPKHAIVKGIYRLRETHPQLAEDIARQVFDNALIEAGLLEETHHMVGRLNSILTTLVAKL